MRAWVIACALSLAWCLWETARLSRRAARVPATLAPTVACASLTLLVLADSFRSEFEWANSNILMLAAIVLALRLATARPFACGLLLATACFIKYLPLGFLGYFALRRQWRALLGMLIGLAACALAPAAWLGWNENLAGLRFALGGLGTMSGASRTEHAANVIPIDAAYSLSITSGIARMLGPDRSPTRLAALVAVAAAASIAAGAMVYRSHERRILAPLRSGPAPLTLVMIGEWACVIAGALAFSPQTQKRHFNLLVPFVALLVVIAATASGRVTARWWAIATIALLLLGVTPMPNIPGTRQFIDGVWKWAGGPGWLLVACALMLMHAALLAKRESAVATRP
jgi:alpha-1,2-mannosyltransferase